MKRVEPLVLSQANCFHELIELGLSGQLPLEVVHLVQDLILSMSRSFISSTVTRNDLRLAKQYLSGGIQIGDKLYEVQVYVPDDRERGRWFFVLSRVWPNGEIKRLEEV